MAALKRLAVEIRSSSLASSAVRCYRSSRPTPPLETVEQFYERMKITRELRSRDDSTYQELLRQLAWQELMDQLRALGCVLIGGSPFAYFYLLGCYRQGQARKRARNNK